MCNGKVNINTSLLYFRASNPDIRLFMKIHNMTDPVELEKYYIDRISLTSNKLNKTPIVWQEVFDHNPKFDPATIVHVWKSPGEPEMKKVSTFD